MSEPEYHVARQRHLGHMLDELAALKLIDRWYVRHHPNSGGTSDARWTIRRSGTFQQLGTAQAEAVVWTLCEEHGIPWVPVAPPGGVKHWREALIIQYGLDL